MRHNFFPPCHILAFMSYGTLEPHIFVLPYHIIFLNSEYRAFKLRFSKRQKMVAWKTEQLIKNHGCLPFPPPFTLVLCSGLGRKVQYSSFTSFPSIREETDSRNVQKFQLSHDHWSWIHTRNHKRYTWNLDQRKWVFAANSNFLIPISLQPAGVDFWF